MYIICLQGTYYASVHIYCMYNTTVYINGAQREFVLRESQRSSLVVYCNLTLLWKPNKYYKIYLLNQCFSNSEKFKNSTELMAICKYRLLTFQEYNNSVVN